MAKQLKTFDDFSNYRSVTKDNPPRNPQQGKEKRKFPLNLSPELFWTIFSAFIIGSFFLGLYIGQAKFDKDKIDYYNQNSDLKKDTARLHQQIKFLQTVNKQMIKK